jgi:hypothetical protein
MSIMLGQSLHCFWRAALNCLHFLHVNSLSVLELRFIVVSQAFQLSSLFVSSILDCALEPKTGDYLRLICEVNFKLWRRLISAWLDFMHWSSAVNSLFASVFSLSWRWSVTMFWENCSFSHRIYLFSLRTSEICKILTS